jgi:HD superfamily phosphohydrolase
LKTKKKSFVFPNAVHTRFEHSLGVGFLANEMIKRFKSFQPELDISDREVELVTVAGLCHDLGHGPFSHAFEGWAHSLKNNEFKHEDMSNKLLKMLVEQNDLKYSDKEVKLIQDMIVGNVPSDYKRSGRSFLFEIVANKTNGVDVDKFDYLERDAHATSMPEARFTRLILASRVTDGHVTFRYKEGFSILELFQRRFAMFKTVYCHAVGVAIELMLCDLLTLANKPLRLEERMTDPAQFVYLNDSIQYEIEVSRSEDLKEARTLLARLRERDLYRAIGGVAMHGKDNLRRFKDNLEHHTTMVAELCDKEAKVSVSDVIIHLNRIDYGFSTDNPLDKVLCFKNWEDPRSTQLNIQDLTAIVPTKFQEVNVR